MREVTLRIRHHGEPESDVSASHPAVTIRSVSSLTGTETERRRIVELTGPVEEIRAFLDEFEAADPVIDIELVSSLDSQVFVGVTYDSDVWDSIAQRLAEHGVNHQMGTTIRAGWEHWTLYLSEGDDLAEIVATIEKAGNDVELVRDVALDAVTGHDPFSLSRMINVLTDRQCEALAAAIGLGYYEPGSDVTIEDIADALDIGSSTAWEHLMRAEHKIMAEVGEHLATRGLSEG